LGESGEEIQEMIQQEAYQNSLSAFDTLDDLRIRLRQHELYGRLTSHHNIAIFMKHHVWAVWDFMSLVKALQSRLTSVAPPWRPVGDPEIRYLINDIVVGEESDLDRHGQRTSHFEMYLTAMKGLGAGTERIESFIGLLGDGRTVDAALDLAGAPEACARFVRQTFRVITEGRLHEIASVFTFGREDVIPTMFLGMLDRLAGTEGGDLADLRYYLERHVEVDGGHHGPLARRMIEILCDGQPARYNEAVVAARAALESRIALWDAIVARFEG
jgi:hypothetical protein